MIHVRAPRTCARSPRSGESSRRVHQKHVRRIGHAMLGDRTCSSRSRCAASFATYAGSPSAKRPRLSSCGDILVYHFNRYIPDGRSSSSRMILPCPVGVQLWRDFKW
jgi:hypothetical protein